MIHSEQIYQHLDLLLERNKALRNQIKDPTNTSLTTQEKVEILENLILFEDKVENFKEQYQQKTKIFTAGFGEKFRTIVENTTKILQKKQDKTLVAEFKDLLQPQNEFYTKYLEQLRQLNEAQLENEYAKDTVTKQEQRVAKVQEILKEQKFNLEDFTELNKQFKRTTKHIKRRGLFMLGLFTTSTLLSLFITNPIYKKLAKAYNTYTDVYYDSSLGSLYGKDIANMGKTFVFTDKFILREFIKNYVSQFENEPDKIIDLNFIDVSNITDLSYVLAGEFDVLRSSEFDQLGIYYSDGEKKIKYYYLSGFGYIHCLADQQYIPKKIDISKWNVSNVQNLNMTFICGGYEPDVSNWDVANLKEMQYTFALHPTFNSDLSKWNVSNVTTMRGAFDSATKFNQDISNWNVGNVRDMSYMFYSAVEFNADISRWNVSKVQNTFAMFMGARSFKQDLNTWDIASLRNSFAMFKSSAMSFNEVYSWKDKLSFKNYNELFINEVINK
ncbi:hypothetical protein CKF54_04100 [Psittacicella hinzii]|uniref:BspA family leucine-rich repeat surface protein n=1 Tax=Psittacicella hinzii TaxID=2028575 RepID=A0A3A1Y3H5_9GAMM|nr:BspA family leucine-rich repeat surface protein [Psittacicella hinzii]RIY32882.1 hypothetical protein CKF54_04100 [Psittacicella hinzii]